MATLHDDNINYERISSRYSESNLHQDIFNSKALSYDLMADEKQSGDRSKKGLI